MAARKTTKKKSAKKAPARSSKAGSRRSSTTRKPAKKAASKTSAAKTSSSKKASSKKASSKKASGAKAAGKKAGRKTAASRKQASGEVDRVAEIQRVIDVMVEAGAVEVELEEAGSKLRVRLKEDPPVSVVGYAPPAAPVAGGPAPVAVGQAPGSGAAPAAAADDGARSVFKSPMVGTFYRAASPDAEPYADVGTEIHADSTICILEAMKVMNEIKAETEGRVVEILVQNGEPVEFGQPLFVIEGL